MAWGTFPAPPPTGCVISVGFRPVCDSVSTAECKMIRILPHRDTWGWNELIVWRCFAGTQKNVQNGIGPGPATKLKVASLKFLWAFGSKLHRPVQASLAQPHEAWDGRPGSSHRLKEGSQSFQWVPACSPGGLYLQRAYLLKAPQLCTFLPVPESIMQLCSFETEPCGGSWGHTVTATLSGNLEDTWGGRGGPIPVKVLLCRRTWLIQL